jgi:hypothetical protein
MNRLAEHDGLLTIEMEACRSHLLIRGIEAAIWPWFEAFKDSFERSIGQTIESTVANLPPERRADNLERTASTG